MRSVQGRLDWFRKNRPEAVGMCLRHTWMATDIPAVGMVDANAALAYVRKHGHLVVNRHPPKGAWVFWYSATHGHVALSLGDQRILSTDVNGPATTGSAGLSYPETHWGHTYAGWSSWYGTAFPVGDQRRRHLLKRRETLKEKLARVRAKLRRKGK